MSPTLHKALVPLTVMLIDLQATPPAVIATHRAGLGASGVSFNKQGNLVLVANRNEATVSVFTVEGKVLTPARKVKLGDEKSCPSHVICDFPSVAARNRIWTMPSRLWVGSR